MGGSIRLGRILGFEIRLDYSWFLVFFLMTWSLSNPNGVFPNLYHFGPRMSWALGILASLLLFASVLVHEISHAVMARMFQIEVNGITLFLFGGVAQIKGEPRSPKAEFFIAGIGPVVSLALGLSCLALSWPLAALPNMDALAALINYLGIINVVLAVFNMIPGFPLDGGRVLRSAIWHFTGSVRAATRWASLLGQAFAWLLIAYGLVFLVLLKHDLSGLWLVFVGWFLNNAADAAYSQLLLRRALSGVSVTHVMSHDLPYVDAELRIPQFVDSYLLRYGHSIYPVMRDGEFAGVITAEDVCSLDREVWGVTSIGAMAHSPERERVVEDDQDAWDALTQMMENDAPRLLVMHQGRLEGIVSRESIIRLVQTKMRLGLAAQRRAQRSLT